MACSTGATSSWAWRCTGDQPLPSPGRNAVTTDTNIENAVPPETRQFDFWIGEWDVTWDGGGGTNSIRAILDGHVIEERFHSSDLPLQGMSLSVYSPQLGQWEQTWVDSQG